MKKGKIILKEQLAEEIFKFDIYAPDIAKAARPGQFVIVMAKEDSERIPLTITDSDSSDGTISLIFQTIGKSTHVLASLDKDEYVAHIAGPLGSPTEIKYYGRVLCVGGGIGSAPLYPIARAMKDLGNVLWVILGFQNKNMIILEKEFARIADRLIVCTNDGSYGIKDLVSVPLEQICKEENPPDFVVVIGSAIMMKVCSDITKHYNIKTIASLNSIMIDGTGMCGGCRVTVDGVTKFVCIDGPEFDAHKIDFDNLIKRLNTYRDIETKKHHECHLRGL